MPPQPKQTPLTTTSNVLTDAQIIARRLLGLSPLTEGATASLADRFLIPPFSVLDARQGYWQKRKREWLAVGIKSELGRGENLQPMAAEDLGEGLNSYREAKKPNATPGGSPLEVASLKNGKTQRGDGRGRPLKSDEGRGKNLVAVSTSDQSINIDFYAKKRKLEAELHRTLTTDEARNILIERGEIKHVDRTNEGKKRDREGKKLAITFGSGKPGDLASGFKSKADNRAIKDHDWLRSHGKEIPQAGKSTNRLAPGGTGANTAWRGVGGEPGNEGQSGTSIFDPVICELAYRWFTPVGGRVLDPFAGGSVRGIVAAKLRRSYVGIDLRTEQIEANEEQARLLCPDAELTWLVGDSDEVLDSLGEEAYDFVFSCPPYADLERYSDDPRDISTMSYEDFLAVYRSIIAKSCAKLAEDRFACFVVGDMRDKNGNYRSFVADTIAAFRDAGLHLYNDAVLVTSVGSLPIRVGRQFAGYRKLGKTHQNVLVFVKGDAGRASLACGTVDVADLAMPPCPAGEAIAVALQDLGGTDLFDTFGERVTVSDMDDDTGTINGDTLSAACLCDLERSEARLKGTTQPRVWVSRNGQWESVPESVTLSILSNGLPMLNPSLFRSGITSSSTAPTTRPLTIGKRMRPK